MPERAGYGHQRREQRQKCVAGRDRHQREEQRRRQHARRQHRAPPALQHVHRQPAADIHQAHAAEPQRVKNRHLKRAQPEMRRNRGQHRRDALIVQMRHPMPRRHDAQDGGAPVPDARAAPVCMFQRENPFLNSPPPRLYGGEARLV